MAEQHYPECERHRDGSPDCCICVRLEEHGHELLDNYFTDLRAKAEGLGHWIDCEAFENLNEGSDYGNENIRETGEPCSCLIGEFLALLDGAQ